MQLTDKIKLWWFNIGRDKQDYRRGDIVNYKGSLYEVYDRQYDRVDIDNGRLGISRHSDELKLVCKVENRKDLDPNNPLHREWKEEADNEQFEESLSKALEQVKLIKEGKISSKPFDEWYGQLKKDID